MAMTKAEKAEMERLRNDLALSRAMRWPDYPKPAPMTRADIEAGLVEGGEKWGKKEMVARGWFQNAYGQYLSYGCSSGMTHSRSRDTTDSQNMGCMYATEADAARAMRLEMTEDFAKKLAAVDRLIAEAE